MSTRLNVWFYVFIILFLNGSLIAVLFALLATPLQLDTVFVMEYTTATCAHNKINKTKISTSLPLY